MKGPEFVWEGVCMPVVLFRCVSRVFCAFPLLKGESVRDPSRSTAQGPHQLNSILFWNEIVSTLDFEMEFWHCIDDSVSQKILSA